MTVKRKFVPGASLKDDSLGERQIRVVASTATPDRVKDVMIPEGCDLSHYRANPVVLANHDPSHPIGTADVEVKNGRVEALITFAPAGASHKADEYCALAKAGVLNAVSVGFEPTEAEPIRGGGERVKSWSLMELSLVSVPCNPEAVVIARSMEKAEGEKWKVGASRNLPLDEDSDWDGPAAAASIFEKAGFDGDDPDASYARKGFLVYDASSPTLKGSYKLPFAKVVDGRLTALASGLRSAASRLPQTDIPDDVAEKARDVIDHYEAKMKDKGASAGGRKGAPKGKIKGLYDVASLAYCLQNLGYIQAGSEWERECEEDDSAVPEMLTEAMRSLGQALIAMTVEEVTELIGDEAGDESATKGLPGIVALRVKSAKSPLLKAMIVSRAKAGRAFSSENEKMIKAACETIKSGHDSLMGMLDKANSDNESGEETPATDTGKGAPTALSKREREIELLKLKSA